MLALIRRLLAPADAEVRFLLVEPDGTAGADANLGVPLLLPGSFNPLHEGHELLARAAETQTGGEVTFEISVVNVDKPPITEDEVLRRTEQFRGRGRVALTRAPTFIEKGRLFPGSVFVLGWDTAVRLVEPRYYGDGEAMRAAFEELRALGCRFLVAGRAVDGTFMTLADIEIPRGFASMFEAIPEAMFRVDVSSTERRGSG